MLGMWSLLLPHAKLEAGLFAGKCSPVMCSEGDAR